MGLRASPHPGLMHAVCHATRRSSLIDGRCSVRGVRLKGGTRLAVVGVSDGSDS
jgi:hypothetical protein